MQPVTLRLARPDRGALFVVSGPSGVGKSTLVSALMSTIPDLAFSVSATTRAPRDGEQHGVHYHFVDEATFVEQIGRASFLEHAQVYGRRYGTLRAPVEAALAEGRSILLDIDVQGAMQVRERLPEAVLVFVLPPDKATVEQRLRARGKDSDEVIATRLREMDAQTCAVDMYDYLVVNDDLATANATMIGVVLAELSRRERRGRLVQQWTAPPPVDPA